MKKTIKLALVATMALGATSAFATNGTALIGYGAKSRGMGGTGVAQFQGAESGFNNPALIGYAKGTEVSIGGTYFAPDVSFEGPDFTSPTLSNVTEDSTANASMIPAVSMAEKVNDKFAWGLALYGVGGMGVDYRESPSTTVVGSMPANDNLMLMRFTVPLAWVPVEGLSFGLAPIVEYGALSMTTGVTTDIAYGFEVGAAYQIAGVTLGLDYKSAVTHDFKNTFDSKQMVYGTGNNSDLDTPQTIAAGISYNFLKNHTIAVDYKNIAYSSAAGFEDFGWEDQNVFALGYEFAADTWAVRVGYNYGASPLPTEIDATFADGGASANQVIGSLAMFPAVTESHYTVGGSYMFSERTSLDAAFVYGTGSASADIPANTWMMGSPAGEITANNDQISLTAALNFNF